MRLKIAALAVIGTLAFAGVASADLMLPGHLIKTADRTTVYVIGPDFKRHVFPDEKTYYTWYRDFSNVQTVSAEVMASVSLGANMTRKPGIGLVKIQSDPKVYFIDVGAVLRWLPDETYAQSLFGPNWNKLVQDIPDGFFVDYSVGPPLDSSAPVAPPVASAASGSATSSSITSVSELGYKVPTVGQPGTVTIALGDAPASTVTLGTRDATLATFNLVAPSDSAAIIQSLRLVGYIDAAEGDSDFQPGYDLDLRGSTEFLSGLVPSVKLVNPTTGAVISGPTLTPSDGGLNFGSLNLRLESGTTLKLALRSDLSSTYDFGANPDRLAFDLTALAATKPDGSALGVAGLNPNGGASPLRALLVKRFGRAEFTWRGGVGDVLAGHESLLGTLDLKAVDEAFRLDKLTFTTRGQYDSVKSLRLEWLGADGAARSASRDYQAATIFDGLGIQVGQGTTLTFRLYGTLYGPDRAKRNEEIVVDFNATSPLSLISLATGSVVDQNSDGDHLKIDGRVGDFLVRFTTLAARLNLASPTSVARVDQAEVLHFSLTTGVDGPARVRHLSFLVKPSDVNTQGSSNDLLERWADAVGNGGTASGIATLRSSLDGYVTRLGQSDNGQIRYALYRKDARLDASAGVTTIPNDGAVFDFTWTDDWAPVLAAGSTTDFRLQLDTSYFLAGNRTMTVQLLGGRDFEWVDTVIGSPGSTVDGTNVSGLPLQTPSIYVQ